MGIHRPKVIDTAPVDNRRILHNACGSRVTVVP